MAKRQRLTREQSKARTRAEVLRAAGRLFLRDGFVATSLAAIAEEAGVTKGAVYSNFESKEDLFYAIVRGDGDASSGGTPEALAPADLSALADGNEPLKDRFADHGRYVASLAPSAQQVALFLEYNAFALRNPRTRSWVRDYNKAFFDELGARLSDHVGGGADPEAAAIAQSLYVGLLVSRAFDPETFDEELFARAFSLLSELPSEAPQPT